MRTALTSTVISVAILELCAHVSPARAQIFKCVDTQGHVTYQETACSGGQKGGAVELKDPLTTQKSVNESNWSVPARERRAIVGMPKTFVTEALGKPSEIRAARQGETGSEVWVYPQPGQVTRVGFADNAVAWIRSDIIAPEPRATNASPNEREARVNSALQVGRGCNEVLQQTGAPDREEMLVAGNTSGARYIYAFDATNANAYAAFVCLGGRVTSVERFTPEKSAAPAKDGAKP